MAGDWLKIRDDLPDDIEVIRMASILELSQDSVVGKLVRFWSWVDRHIADGHAAGVTNVFIDEYVRHAGFAHSLSEVGWLKFNEHGFDIPNFERHLSECAKRRALALDRKKRERSRSRRDKSVTREESIEKRDDDESTSVLPRRPPERIDWGMHFERFNAIASRLGVKPIQELTDGRQRKLRIRLKDHPNLWDEVEEEAKHLGMWAREKGFINFDWLMSPGNLTKFLEGTYRPKGQ